MDRRTLADETISELFGSDKTSHSQMDTDFSEIEEKFIYGEIYHQGTLDLRTRVLVSIVALASIGNKTHLRKHVVASTRLKIDPVTIKESLYQIAPFVGFALVDDALQIANSVFQELAISAENQPGSVVQESTRFSEGIKIQFPIYDDRIKKNMESLPEEFRENIPRYLTEVCFGDLYTRSGLDLKTREFLILCALCALGGTDAQIRSHGLGNLKVGNTFETILSALIQCLPWVGFPRVLNAINILKEVPY